MKDKVLKNEFDEGKVTIVPLPQKDELRANFRYEKDGNGFSDNYKYSSRSIGRFANQIEETFNIGEEEKKNVKKFLTLKKEEAEEIAKEKMKEMKDMNQKNTSSTKIKSGELEKYKNQKRVHDKRLSGIIDGTYFLTAWFKVENTYQPIVVTKDNLYEVRNKLTETLVELKEEGKDPENILTDSEKRKLSYDYFAFDGEEVRFQSEVPRKPPKNLNYLDNGIIPYIEEEKEIRNRDELWNYLEGFLKKSWEHYETDWYKILSAHVIHTYLLMCIGFTPYIVLAGKENTGKSQCMKALSLLDYNGFFAGNSTPTVVTRLAHSYQVSLHQDEFDKLSDERKQQLIGLYNTGYRKGAVYTQTDNNPERISDQIRQINSFCAKTMSANSFGYEWDDSFKSRTTRIKSVKASGNVLNLDKLREDQLEELQDFRNQLAVYCLRNWEEVLNAIEEAEDDIDATEREAQIVAMYQGIINHFEDNLTDVTEHLMEQKALDETTEKLNKREKLILKYIITKFPPNLDEEEILLKDIRDYVNSNLNGIDATSKSVSGYLRDLDLIRDEDQKHRTAEGTAVKLKADYISDTLERNNLKELKERWENKGESIRD